MIVIDFVSICYIIIILILFSRCIHLFCSSLFLQFFDKVDILNPRLYEFCSKTSLPSPSQVLEECVRRWVDIFRNFLFSLVSLKCKRRNWFWHSWSTLKQRINQSNQNEWYSCLFQLFLISLKESSVPLPYTFHNCLLHWPECKFLSLSLWYRNQGICSSIEFSTFCEQDKSLVFIITCGKHTAKVNSKISYLVPIRW